MSNIETHFIKPLSEFYGRNPFGPGFAKRLEPYAQTLSADALQAIATRLIERGGKSFPSFTNCREALSRGDAALTPRSFEPRAWEFAQAGLPRMGEAPGGNQDLPVLDGRDGRQRRLAAGSAGVLRRQWPAAVQQRDCVT
jgi:hypothetical protein